MISSWRLYTHLVAGQSTSLPSDPREICLPVVKAHLAGNITGGREGLLFPAAGDPTKHLAPATLYRVFYKAREAAGRPDLRFHDLRHTGAVLAAARSWTTPSAISWRPSGLGTGSTPRRSRLWRGPSSD